MKYEANHQGEPLTLGDLREFVKLCDTVGLHSDLKVCGEPIFSWTTFPPELKSLMIETGSNRYGESKV